MIRYPYGPKEPPPEQEDEEDEDEDCGNIAASRQVIHGSN
jgi:hypothetical protein